jgi:hypothetical protein
VLQKKHRGKIIVAIVALAVSLLLVAGATWLFFNRQFVADHITVWSFKPSTAVETIERRIKLTDDGKFYFYATQPIVADADAFNVDCPRQEKDAPILGCYTQGKMFIYDIKNSALDGVKEVTAAHEMLHAVWERLPSEEQTRLGTLLLTDYNKYGTEELTSRMAYYERTQPGEVINELHSILPTEYRTLSPELETYYSRFFEDRQLIVLLNEQYSAVFNDLVDQIDTLYEEITQLGAQIETDRTSYTASVTALDRDITSFNQRADSGGFSNITQFNNERFLLVGRSNSLEALGAELSADIDRYNAMLEQYETIASQLESLNRSIDSISDVQQAPSL